MTPDVRTEQKWSVHKWKCRNGYRDGCAPVWLASPPDDDEDSWISFEFDTWDEAMQFVRNQLQGVSP